MLIEYGNTTVRPDWVLDEKTPTGYSRIYYVVSGDLMYESAEGRRAMRPGFLYALPSTVPYRVERDPRVDFTCTYLHVVFGGYRVTGLIETPVEEGSCLEALIRTVGQAIREKRIELLEGLSEDFSFFLREDERFTRNSEMLTRVQRYILHHLCMLYHIGFFPTYPNFESLCYHSRLLGNHHTSNSHHLLLCLL